VTEKSGEYSVRERPANAYESRIRELRNFGEEDGAPMSAASLQDFRRFAADETDVREAELFLCENGNLSAVWEDGGDTQLDLEFLGSGDVKFIIFKNSNDGAGAESHSGFNTLEGLESLIDEYGLRPLLA